MVQVLDNKIYQHHLKCVGSPMPPIIGLPPEESPQTACAGAGGRGAAAKKHPAIMDLPGTHVEQLERFLLRRGVGALEADRNHCADCGRTPLTGEHIHLYDCGSTLTGGRKRGIVCELCRALRREHPIASEIVRHCEHGHTVRLTARAA
jgi:hypothetical protein